MTARTLTHKMKTIPVVIPYFRAPEAIQTTVACLKRQIGVQTEIFIRDNSEDNILFTRAVNEGLRKFAYLDAYPYILVLNQDAFLREDCLLRMSTVMDLHPSVGICTPVSLSRDGRINWCGGLEAYPWGRHKTMPINELPENPYETYWANGACMLLRTQMIRDIGVMDENMKFICSDSDYSFTARARGWKVIVEPKSFVEHSLSGSSDKADLELSKIKLEDQLYFSNKWLSGEVYKKLAYSEHEINQDFIHSEKNKTEKLINHLNSF